MISIHKYIPESYINSLQLQQFVIASVQKQKTSRFIQILRLIPNNFQKFGHLKRVRKREHQDKVVDVLLCLQKDENTLLNIKNELGELIIQLKTESIPYNMACSKKQYLQWSQYWPINFVQQEIFKQIKHNALEVEFMTKIINLQDQLVLFDEGKILYTIKILQGCPLQTISHTVMMMLEEWPKCEQFKSLKSVYYLTKLKLYCTKQLCGMCCMALVHSRLQRIYFPKFIDIKDLSQIICCQKLNHRIKIFQIMQEQS